MFNLTVATPEKSVFENIEAKELTVPGYLGELNVLPGHAPLMTTLTPGILQVVKADGTKEKMAICWGYCEINPKGVHILAETALRPEELDADRLKQDMEDAQKALVSGELSPDDYEANMKRLQKAMARQRLVQ